MAKANGCAHAVIVSSREDIAARVREITDGKGVPVVYDSVGKSTIAGFARTVCKFEERW